MPAADELGPRLSGVLAVIYLLFNEGYLCSAGDAPQRRDLTDDAEWLAGLLARLMPAEPEVLGLLALIRLHRARAAARFDAEGRLVLLRHQDRACWDHAKIAAAANLVVRAAQLRRPGPYQLQAAIVACHAEAASWETTDWMQILLLYDALICHLPSPVTRLHRAIALGQVLGPRAALDRLTPSPAIWTATTCTTPPAPLCARARPNRPGPAGRRARAGPDRQPRRTRPARAAPRRT